MTEKPKNNESLLLQNIVKVFPQRGNDTAEVRAVDDVSITINDGEFVTLLGPSGCGKTTTLRLIAGFEQPTEGKIVLHGKDITHHAPNVRDMAMVFQSYALFPHMTVSENVEYGLRVNGETKQSRESKVQTTLELVGLTGLGDRQPNELSGGQQQRVALARSLVMEPSVLLFDEPLSNLDAKLRVQMRSEILALQRRLGLTSVYVTHDQEEAMALSDRIVIMNNGKIEQVGDPRDVYRFPESQFVADFIGRANFVETTAIAIEDNQPIITLFGNQVTIPTHYGVKEGQTVTAVLRPESISLGESGDDTVAIVEQVMYLGSEIEYLVRYQGDEYIVLELNPYANKIFEVGEHASILVTPEAIHLLL